VLQLLSNLVKIAQMLGHNVLRHRLVLAIDDVHVEFPFAALDDGAQLGGILDAVVEGLEENAVEEARLVGNSYYQVSHRLLSVPFINRLDIPEHHPLLPALQVIRHGNITVGISDFGDVAAGEESNFHFPPNFRSKSFELTHLQLMINLERKTLPC
jgi:hypothetical protein